MSLRSALLAFCLALSVAPAWAQDDPELGDTGVAASQAKGSSRRRGGSARRVAANPQPSPPAATATTPVDPNAWGTSSGAESSVASDPNASTTTASTNEWERPPGFEGESGENDAKGDTDHEKIVRRVGIGLLGTAEVPLGLADPIGTSSGSRALDPVMTAPVLGLRYWFGKRVGLEVGVGFMVRQGSIKQSGGASVDAKATALAATVGLPISLANGKHYNLMLIPYGGFGNSSATDTRGTASNNDDVFGKGTLIEGGLKGGVEVQLGAIGLEGLALQITAGVRLRVEKTSANVPVYTDGKPTGDTNIDTSNLVFTTSPGSSLGSAVAGSLAAIYYF